MTDSIVPDAWMLPPDAWTLSISEMAQDGRIGCEGTALWLGHRQGHLAEITHVVAARGRGVVKKPDLLLLTADLINEVALLAAELGVYLVGQIHSHGPGYIPELSDTDKLHGIRAPGFLSAVAPDYCLRPHTRAEDCSFNVFEHGDWRAFDHQEIARRVLIEGATPVQLLVVGVD